jgi:hypothetical protein
MNSEAAQMQYVSRHDERDVHHAIFWGIVVAAILILLIYLGSNRFRHFDAALIPYAGASVFAAFGIGYRYGMWLRRPPTRKYWFRGWQIFFRPSVLIKNIGRLIQLFLADFFAQRFIEKRSHLRWAAHWLIAWGCILAAAVTFPLSFGWVHFESSLTDQNVYHAFVFGIQVGQFHLGTLMATISFNILDISAVMVLAGVSLALFRRARSRCHRGAAICARHDASTPAVRDFHYGTLSDGFHSPAPWTELRLPLDAACRHGDLYASLSAIREVLSHLFGGTFKNLHCSSPPVETS